MLRSTRGQQAMPSDNNPKPAIRAMASDALETSGPNTNLTMLGAMINPIPVTASRVEAIASSTLFIISCDFCRGLSRLGRRAFSLRSKNIESGRAVSTGAYR
jgi:hypothetical protein